MYFKTNFNLKHFYFTPFLIFKTLHFKLNIL